MNDRIAQTLTKLFDRHSVQVFKGSVQGQCSRGRSEGVQGDVLVLLI